LIIVTLLHIIYNEKLEFTQDGGGDISVSVKGHAVPEDSGGIGGSNTAKGENIICAAVSFAALTLLRSIKIVGNIDPDYTFDDGMLQFSVKVSELDSKKKQVLKILIESFIIGILDLKQQYKDFITIQFN